MKIINLYEKSSVQSIVFSKSQFSKERAQNWLKSHNFKSGIRETTNTYRARQKEPHFSNYRISSIKPGIKFVYGY